MIYVGANLLKDGALLRGGRAPPRAFPACGAGIGGHLAPRGTLEQALVREVAEEIGVTPRQFGKLTSLNADDIELHIYRVDMWTNGSPALHGDEHVELRWFSVAEACVLPNLASAKYIRVFRELHGPTSPLRS